MKGYTFYAERPVDMQHKTDLGLVVATLLMWGLGMVTMYICTPDTAARLFDGDRYHFVVRHVINSAVGFSLLLFFAIIPMDKIRKLLPLFVLGTLVLCFLTFLPKIGVKRNGAPRWIAVPFMGTFQPSELAKFAVVLFLANLFDRQKVTGEYDDDANSFMKPLGGLLVFVSVVFAQKDLSTGILIFVVGASLFFVSGARISWFFPLFFLGVLAGGLLTFKEEYRVRRLIAFFKPEQFANTTGYQLSQSKKAIISGGVWGQGLGTGLERTPYIPEVYADYIFAGWTEAMGFIGVIAYILLLVFFAWRAFKVSFTSPDRFAALGTFGCTVTIVVQSLLNLAVVCGAVPTTGIPLPFFSYGGSSIIVTLAMCGFMLNASRCEYPSDSYAVSGSNKIESYETVVE
ncbi:MAG: cell division protein FtsW [Treponema sp.]|nr:cell division protein FtsW [Treponema sp.]